jgi:hypothetical protein
MNLPANARRNRTHKLVLRIAVLLALSGFGSAAALGQETWDHTDSPRFQLLAPFANQAILDRETGLVWERTPSGAALTWFQAQDRCNRLVLGNRMGWRVPAIQELTSILSIGAPNNLEPGNLFVGLPPNNQMIWSGTTSAINQINVWVMSLSGNLINNLPKASFARCWCVRFRQGTDAQ